MHRLGQRLGLTVVAIPYSRAKYYVKRDQVRRCSRVERIDPDLHTHDLCTCWLLSNTFCTKCNNRSRSMHTQSMHLLATV
jgi:hypothetical protein